MPWEKKFVAEKVKVFGRNFTVELDGTGYFGYQGHLELWDSKRIREDAKKMLDIADMMDNPPEQKK